MVLSEDSNTIDVLYNRMEDPSGRATGTNATVGIQQDMGTRVDQVGYNMAVVASAISSRVTTSGGMKRMTLAYVPAFISNRLDSSRQ